MNIRHQKHILLMIGFFLASFLGALTLSTLCDLEVVELATTGTHSHEELNRNSAHGHHHGTSHAHSADSDKSPDSGTSQAPTTDSDECCSDAANTLESSLFSGIAKLKIPLAKFFVIGIIETPDFVTLLYHFDNNIHYDYDDPPPLNGFRLRVVLQSFLI